VAVDVETGDQPVPETEGAIAAPALSLAALVLIEEIVVYLRAREPEAVDAWIYDVVTRLRTTDDPPRTDPNREAMFQDAHEVVRKVLESAARR
jgi:hypothetical protein